MFCKLDVRRKAIVTLALYHKTVVRYFLNRSPGFRRGPRILQGRASNPSERDTAPNYFDPCYRNQTIFWPKKKWLAPGGVTTSRAMSNPLLSSYSSCFVFTKHPVQLKTVTTCFQNMFFSKNGHLNKRAGVWTRPLDPPLRFAGPPCVAAYRVCVTAAALEHATANTHPASNRHNKLTTDIGWTHRWWAGDQFGCGNWLRIDDYATCELTVR